MSQAHPQLVLRRLASKDVHSGWQDVRGSRQVRAFEGTVECVSARNSCRLSSVNSSGSGDTFEESFYSELSETEPILPTTTEQCKDGGFAAFQVFENQGDCVSFVETEGKKEPGKNQN